MSLQREHPDHPLNNGRVGDKVIWGNPDRRLKEGVVISVGNPPVGDTTITSLEIKDRDGNHVLLCPIATDPWFIVRIFPPKAEVEALCPDGDGDDMREWLEEQLLFIARNPNNSDTPDYIFIGGEEDDYAQVTIENNEYNVADMKFGTDGFWNDDFVLTRNGLQYMCGDRAIEAPIGFEPDFG